MHDQTTWMSPGELRHSPQRGTGSSLTMTFHPDSCPEIWELCGLVAEFVCNYTGTFFESQPQDQYLTRAEVEDAISYILIELMENALKFNIAGDIDVHLELYQGELRFYVRNQIWRHDATKLESVFQELIAADPSELLVQRIEENAAHPELGRSGLGFLTIMNDYGASLGWSFASCAHPDHVSVTIITRFPLHKSEA